MLFCYILKVKYSSVFIVNDKIIALDVLRCINIQYIYDEKLF